MASLKPACIATSQGQVVGLCSRGGYKYTRKQVRRVTDLARGFSG